MDFGSVNNLCVLIVFFVAMIKIVGIRADVREIRRLLRKQAGESDDDKSGSGGLLLAVAIVIVAGAILILIKHK